MPLFTICLHPKPKSNKILLCQVEGRVVSFPEVPESSSYTFFLHNTAYVDKGIQINEDTWCVSEKSTGRRVSGGDSCGNDAMESASKVLEKNRDKLQSLISKLRSDYLKYSNGAEVVKALDEEVALDAILPS